MRIIRLGIVAVVLVPCVCIVGFCIVCGFIADGGR
jgi:hypothetical protein